MSERIVTRTISNLGIGKRRALLMGIKGTRNFLEQSGADGLAWTPLRSRLGHEIKRDIRRGNFRNTVGKAALIGSMDQSFAPTTAEIIQRYKERKANGEGWLQRVKKFGRAAIERGIMPPAVASLELIKKVANANTEGTILTNVYPEYFPNEEWPVPYETSVQLTADTIEFLGVDEMRDLPEELVSRGIYNISFSSYNTERRSRSGEATLPDWRTWLPEYATRGLIRQVSVSLNRTDLPDVTGAEAMQATHTLGSELIKDQPDQTKLGDLPEQLGTILANLPKQSQLDISLRGPISKYKPEQIRKIFENIDRIAGINRVQS